MVSQHDIADPDETDDVQVQIWNKGCYSCHVSQEEKNYDNATDSYKTVWLNSGTNFERCHGPGSEHVANHSSATRPPATARDIVLQTRLDPLRNTMVCAQCHSFRDIYVNGFTAGSNYYDFFLPVLEFDQPVNRDPAYWPDGRTRWRHLSRLSRSFVRMPTPCAPAATPESATPLRLTLTTPLRVPEVRVWNVIRPGPS